MSDTDQQTSNTGEPQEIKKNKGKKRLILIIFAVLLVGSGVGGYLYFKKKNDHKINESKIDEQKTEIKKEEPKPKETLFLNLDEFLVNLQNGDKQASFLKIEVTLQIGDKDIVKKVQEKMPIIQDSFQTYLRELRADDLQGSAGIYRLRDELLLRINKIMSPNGIDDILFREFLVQ